MTSLLEDLSLLLLESTAKFIFNTPFPQAGLPPIWFAKVAISYVQGLCSYTHMNSAGTRD